METSQEESRAETREDQREDQRESSHSEVQDEADDDTHGGGDERSAELSQPVAQVVDAIQRGDLRSARALIADIRAGTDALTLNALDQASLDEIDERLRFDLAELLVPLALFTLWAVLFWRTLH